MYYKIDVTLVCTLLRCKNERLYRCIVYRLYFEFVYIYIHTYIYIYIYFMKVNNGTESDCMEIN